MRKSYFAPRVFYIFSVLYNQEPPAYMENIHTNEHLRRLCLNDSQEAFHFLYAHYYPKVKLFLKFLLKSDHYTEDIIADVFFKVWDRRKLLLTVRNFDAYLLRMARNTAMSSSRCNIPVSINDINDTVTLTASDDPSAKIENNELYNRIEETVKSLPPKTRLVFEMVRYNKLRYKEVAEILDISVKTVEWHMTTAIRTIREAISDYNN